VTDDPAPARPTAAEPLSEPPSEPVSKPRSEPPSEPRPGPDRDELAAAIPEEVVRQSLDAIIITDTELRVRTWNPTAVRLYGIDAEAALGRTMRDLVDTLDAGGKPIDGAVARAELETSGVWRQRIVHRPRIGPLAGQDIVVDSLVTLLRGPDGTPVGALGVNRDVTSSAKLESELAALGSLVAATGRARTRSEVALAALELLCRTTGAEAGLVTSTDDEYEAAAHIGIRQETVDVIVSFGRLDGPLAVALEAQGAYVSADVASAPLREDVRTAVLAEGIEHLIIVGLRLADRLIGILALGWRQRAPQEPSRAIMHQAAALVASSMENARLLAAVERGLGEERMLTRRMRALVELTRLEGQPAGSTGHEQLIADVDTIIGADGSAFARVEGDRLVLVASQGVDPAWMAPMVNRPIREMPIPNRLMEGSSAVLVRLDPGAVSDRGRAAVVPLGYQAIASFPIREDGQMVGLLFSLFKRPLEELEIDDRTLDAIGRVLDISFANRRLREGVVASERRYRDLFEASPDALLVEDQEKVVDANEAARHLFGEAIVGHIVTDLYTADPGDIDRAALGPSGISGLIGTGRRLDGSTFPEEVDLRPIEVAGERRILAIVRDLTERTKMQAELVQAQKMEAIGLLVAGVAHELNNPLASIVGFSHLLRTDPTLPADLRHQADLLVQEANRTRVIVQNLLDFARQRPPERVEMDLRPLLDSVLGLQTFVLARSRMTVEVDLEPDLPRIAVDRSQIQQVLINLTVNATQAIRAVDRAGTIRIGARAVRDEEGQPMVRIEVADDGPGVPASIVDRLFMPFTTTKEPGEGTGLGLSVSFGIVASHGGTLRHEPNASGGATFVIELPVGAATTRPAEPRAPAEPTTDPDAGAAAPDADATASAATTPPAASPGRPLRILVLDDEPSIREFLGRVLTRQGHEAILVQNGTAALDIVRRDRLDAILCDHRMAGMSGTEFHDAVMEVAPEMAGRFAFMSGDVLNPELRAFADARQVHLLAKPFDIAAIGAIVATLVAGEPVRGPAGPAASA
jgi:PAS domain S-box-containing protein